MSRVQLALNVNDIDEAVTFYSKLFGAEPAKRRPGYANFAIAEPPLKLVLLENPGQGGSLNHLGIEVPDTGAVDAEQTRLAATGLDLADERDTTCCYAKQDKFWVTGAPGSERWRSIPSCRTAPPSGANTAGSAGTRSRPSWTPPRPGRPPSAAAAPGQLARRTPPPPAPAAASRPCEHASQSPRRCHRWTARPRAGRRRGSCRPARPGRTAWRPPTREMISVRAMTAGTNGVQRARNLPFRRSHSAREYGSQEDPGFPAHRPMSPAHLCMELWTSG